MNATDQARTPTQTPPPRMDIPTDAQIEEDIMREALSQSDPYDPQ